MIKPIREEGQPNSEAINYSYDCEFPKDDIAKYIGSEAERLDRPWSKVVENEDTEGYAWDGKSVFKTTKHADQQIREPVKIADLPPEIVVAKTWPKEYSSMIKVPNEPLGGTIVPLGLMLCRNGIDYREFEDEYMRGITKEQLNTVEERLDAIQKLELTDGIDRDGHPKSILELGSDEDIDKFYPNLLRAVYYKHSFALEHRHVSSKTEIAISSEVPAFNVMTRARDFEYKLSDGKLVRYPIRVKNFDVMFSQWNSYDERGSEEAVEVPISEIPNSVVESFKAYKWGGMPVDRINALINAGLNADAFQRLYMLDDSPYDEESFESAEMRWNEFAEHPILPTDLVYACDLSVVEDLGLGVNESTYSVEKLLNMPGILKNARKITALEVVNDSGLIALGRVS